MRIKIAREAKLWRQKDLARAVQVEAMTVSRWERGEHMPSLDMLGLIAKVTGKTPEFFLDGLGDLERLASLEARLESLRDEARQQHQETMREVAELRELVARSVPSVETRETA
jgi:transcriptional regulator with XRE-family HTH domain